LKSTEELRVFDDADTRMYGPNAYADGEDRVVVSVKRDGLELLLFFDDFGARDRHESCGYCPPAAPSSTQSNSAGSYRRRRSISLCARSDELRRRRLGWRDRGAAPRRMRIRFRAAWHA
jgi:hypothetical protein